LLVFLRRCAQIGGIEFFLANPTGYVSDLLELMGLDSAFEICLACEEDGRITFRTDALQWLMEIV
jgi:hypothetical protein